MTQFEIITDGSAEFFDGYLDKEDIKVLPISIDEKGYHPVSLKDANEAMESILLNGKDVLYIGMTSSLSKSFENVEYIAKGLRIKYPERKIEFINSLTSSCGLGMIVYSAKKLQKEGKTIEEVASFVEENKNKFKSVFVLDNPSDCPYLSINNLNSSGVDIRPIFGFDNQGGLGVVAKVIGRKKSTLEMIKMAKNSDKRYCDYIAIEYIGQQMEAENLKEMLIKAIPDIPIKIVKANEFVSKQIVSEGIAIAYLEK